MNLSRDSEGSPQSRDKASHVQCLEISADLQISKDGTDNYQLPGVVPVELGDDVTEGFSPEIQLAMFPSESTLNVWARESPDCHLPSLRVGEFACVDHWRTGLRERHTPDPRRHHHHAACGNQDFQRLTGVETNVEMCPHISDDPVLCQYLERPLGIVSH